MIYSVTYSDNEPVTESHVLNSEDSVTITVHVEFKRDITNAEFNLAKGTTLLFNQEINAMQKTRELNNEENSNGSNESNDNNSITVDLDMVAGAEYVAGQYTYIYIPEGTYDFVDSADRLELKEKGKGYNEEFIATPSVTTSGGWRVVVTNPNSTDPITEKIYTSINEKPIISMAGTYYKSKATSVDLSGIDTSHVIDMIGMFHVSSITSIDVSDFDTSNVISMSNMFNSSKVSTITGLSNFNTENVINMSFMFAYTNLVTIDLSSFDTSKVKDMYYMFLSSHDEDDPNPEIETIYASNKFVTSSIEDLTTYYQGYNNMENVFFSNSLVGGAGTTYSEERTGIEYARIDNPPNSPGYFTLKP